MRRTTISRSRVFLPAAGLGLLLAVGTVAAQVPPAAQPAQPAPQQPAAQPASPPPATHVVVKGETLWGLAQLYLGDPLLWPEIYRLNESVVEDPHWIVPGEELRLAPAPDEALAAAPEAAAGKDTAAAPGAITVAPTPAETAAAAPPPPPPANVVSGPTIFSQRRQRAAEANITVQLGERAAYRAVREGEHYSSGFLTDDEELSPGQLLGTLATSSIRRLNASTSPQLFADVAFTPPPGDSVPPGELLLVYEPGSAVAGHGYVVRPTGLIKVTSSDAGDGMAQGQVVALYEAMKSGQSLIVARPFQSERGAHPVPIDSGVVGRVIAVRDPHELMELQDVVFLDVGEADSVRAGDIFALSDWAGAAGVGTVSQDLARVLVVNVRPRSSTGVIIHLTRGDIRVGAEARQVMRMPS